jgi:hypothetical protein
VSTNIDPVSDQHTTTQVIHVGGQVAVDPASHGRIIQELGKSAPIQRHEESVCACENIHTMANQVSLTPNRESDGFSAMEVGVQVIRTIRSGDDLMLRCA